MFQFLISMYYNCVDPHLYAFYIEADVYENGLSFYGDPYKHVTSQQCLTSDSRAQP